jgi:hypothetical protein
VAREGGNNYADKANMKAAARKRPPEEDVETRDSRTAVLATFGLARFEEEEMHLSCARTTRSDEL